MRAVDLSVSVTSLQIHTNATHLSLHEHAIMIPRRDTTRCVSGDGQGDSTVGRVGEAR
jgi:hypothetical protein